MREDATGEQTARLATPIRVRESMCSTHSFVSSSGQRGRARTRIDLCERGARCGTGARHALIVAIVVARRREKGHSDGRAYVRKAGKGTRAREIDQADGADVDGRQPDAPHAPATPSISALPPTRRGRGSEAIPASHTQTRTRRHDRTRPRARTWTERTEPAAGEGDGRRRRPSAPSAPRPQLRSGAKVRVRRGRRGTDGGRSKMVAARAGARRRAPHPEADSPCHRGRHGPSPLSAEGGGLRPAWRRVRASVRDGLEDGDAALRAGVLRLHVVEVVPVVLGLVVVLREAAQV